MARKCKTVLICLWSAGSCGRKQLAGILRYVNAGHPWNVSILLDPKDLTPKAIADAERKGTDGFIVFVLPTAAAALARSSVPTILLSYPTPELERRAANLVRFVNDNAAIGRRAAEHILSRGTFASHAFVPDADGRLWSPQREKSFCDTFAKAGHRVHVYRAADGDLGDWLAALPKPTAVMAPFDLGAREIAVTCKRQGLAVPRDVSIIGVDNDELICEATRPTLTSLAIDQEQIGYRAAETLDRLMAARSPRPSCTKTIASGPIVERESTRFVSPSVHVVTRIRRFIDEHFREVLGPDDVAARLGISRRLADLRLTAATGNTVRKALEERRFAEVTRQLASSDLPIATVTRNCGFENDLWVKYVFKRRYGMTMSAWRKRHHLPPEHPV